MADLPREIAIAFDTCGCPNRCRHCWLGGLPGGGIGEEAVREIAGQFRSFVRAGEKAPWFRKVWVSSWLREPDFSDDYREVYQRDAELSDGTPWRYELLSIWRIVRDAGYLAWAKSVGPDTCQITFFGGEETTDWFCGRKGAFADNVGATERLLDAGMRPRWQLFANAKGIDEFGTLAGLLGRMRVRERVEALGGEFDVFVHLWGVCGAAMGIEHLRPTDEDMRRIPGGLLEASRGHHGRDDWWRTEAELCREILGRDDWYGYGLEPGHMAWFFVAADRSVYFNAYGVEPWWCLGNLAREPLGAILRRFGEDDTPGLRAIRTIPAQRLVRELGDADGRKVHSSADDLLRLYLSRRLGRGKP